MKGIAVTDEEYQGIRIVANEEFHPEWNYSICQRNR
jgi:hypothetical protein